MDVKIQSQEEKLRYICNSVRKLYKSIATLTLTSPTAAASLYLNRTDILAQYVSGYLMVWPCVIVDRQWFRNSSECSAYIPIKYSTLHDILDGYLDTFHNRVYSWSAAGDCGPHYVVGNDSLITVYQRRNGLSYTVSSNFSSKPIGPIFKKIEMRAYEWASSSSAMHESRPGEFSYNDLTNPIGVDGITWLEGEIEKTYPMVSYLVHIKIKTVLLILVVLIGTVWAVTRIRHLTRHVRRLEEIMSEVIGLKHTHHG